MNAPKKRLGTTKTRTRTAPTPDNAPALTRYAKATARGCLFAVALSVVLSAVTAAIAYATADPDALLVPLALCVPALSSLIGGLATYRACRTSPLLCGALNALALMLAYFMLSYLLPDELRGQWPSGLRWGLRGGMLAFSMLGAVMGAYASKKRVKRRRHR